MTAIAPLREPELPPLSERPLATMFITSFNQEDFIRDAIEGAFAQTYQPLEIVLSDDASRDGTYRIMEEMVAGYSGPHSLVLNRNETNLGIVPHVDKVMRMAAGELIVENAGDDVSVPWRVARLVEYWLSTDRRAAAIHTARRRMDEAGKVHEVMADERPLHRASPLEVIRDHGSHVGATLAWSREVYDVFGGQAPIAIFDDFPTCFRASLIGEIHYLPEPLLHYRQGGTSAQPEDEQGHHYLHGFRIKNYRWHRSFWRRYLADMETVRPAQYEECRRLCEEKIADADFHIRLAESPWWKLPLAVPAGIVMAFRRRNGHYAKEPFRYLAAPVYRRRIERKHAAARARQDDRVETAAP